MNNVAISVDVLIFGGGISGLWTLNRLQKIGYQAILLEHHTLGSGQTLQSQGIIHGGIKYALTGSFSNAANALATMPHRWQACLHGSGDIDLRTVKILSDHQLLFSTGSIASEITGFFAGKALYSRIKKLSPVHYPLLLQNTQFKGHAYRLEEVVLDTHSLITTLAKPYANHLFKINTTPKRDYYFHTQPDNPQNILSLNLCSGTETCTLQAKRYLLTAGEGNELLTTYLPNAPKMQKRPLHMVLVKFETPVPFFAHCMDRSINPRITITTHQTADGKSVWYVGGQLAEDGATRTKIEQIIIAKQEIKALFPWLDLSTTQWTSFFVNRAEPKQPDGKRPANVFVETIGNIMVAWPTKLALAPVLTDKIIAALEHQNIHPMDESKTTEAVLSTMNQKKPDVGLPPWERLFYNSSHDEF